MTIPTNHVGKTIILALTKLQIFAGVGIMIVEAKQTGRGEKAIWINRVGQTIIRAHIKLQILAGVGTVIVKTKQIGRR